MTILIAPIVAQLMAQRTMRTLIIVLRIPILVGQGEDVARAAAAEVPDKIIISILIVRMIDDDDDDDHDYYDKHYNE